MKKRIFLLCCIVGLLWPTAVYAETAQTSQKSLPQVLRIEDYRYLYIGTVVENGKAGRTWIWGM